MIYIKKHSIFSFVEDIVLPDQTANIRKGEFYTLDRIKDRKDGAILALTDMKNNVELEFSIDYDYNDKSRIKAFSDLIDTLYVRMMFYNVLHDIDNVLAIGLDDTNTGTQPFQYKRIVKGNKLFLRDGCIKTNDGEVYIEANLFNNTGKINDSLIYQIPLSGIEDFIEPSYKKMNSQFENELVVLGDFRTIHNLLYDQAIFKSVLEKLYFPKQFIEQNLNLYKAGDEKGNFPNAEDLVWFVSPRTYYKNYILDKLDIYPEERLLKYLETLKSKDIEQLVEAAKSNLEEPLKADVPIDEITIQLQKKYTKDADTIFSACISVIENIVDEQLGEGTFDYLHDNIPHSLNILQPITIELYELFYLTFIMSIWYAFTEDGIPEYDDYFFEAVLCTKMLEDNALQQTIGYLFDEHLHLTKKGLEKAILDILPTRYELATTYNPFFKLYSDRPELNKEYTCIAIDYNKITV